MLKFCSNRGIKHILSSIGDHRGSGLVERSIQTIKRKLGKAKFDPNFKNLKTLFSLDGNVTDSKPYKALADLARAANKWSQIRRNLPPDAGKLVLKELTTQHSDLAHSLKSGLNSNTLRFSVIASPPGMQVNSRRAPIVQPTRLSRTSKLENLLLSDPGRVQVFRKIIDRQSGKPLYKLTKFKIVRVTDHTYITDKGKVISVSNLIIDLPF